MKKRTYTAPETGIHSFAGNVRLCAESDVRIGANDGRTDYYDVREEEEWDDGPQYEWDKILRQYF